MPDNKTLGQYLKMMKTAEEENDVEEVDTLPDEGDEHPNVYDYGYNKNYDGDDDTYDIVIDELGIEDDLRNIDDEEQDSEEAETIYSTYYQDETCPYWDSKEDFVKDIKDYIANFDPESITDFSPYPNYVCREYLILGITIEHGLMVVTKCFDPEMNQKNLMFYITDQPVFIKEVDHQQE